MLSKKKKNVMLKASPIDLVTETDQAVEKFLFSELRKVFPDHRLVDYTLPHAYFQLATFFLPQYPLVILKFGFDIIVTDLFKIKSRLFQFISDLLQVVPGGSWRENVCN